jgi:peptidoglycan/xylan/chitin deacetylase (PgdA/CDA1 family)
MGGSNGAGSGGESGAAGQAGSAGQGGMGGQAGMGGQGAPGRKVRSCFARRSVAPDAVSAECLAKANEADRKGSARPPGVGYTDGLDPLPDHVAYLTFDDGPSQWTTDFLDVLSQHGVRATFFVTVQRLQTSGDLDASYLDESGNSVRYRDVLARTSAAGHVLGNHGLDHSDLLTLAPSEVERQLDENERAINRALVSSGGMPRPLSLFRPPYGSPFFPQGKPAHPDNSSAVTGALIQDRALNILWEISAGDALDLAQGESTARTGSANTDPAAPTFAAKVARTQSAVLDDARIRNGQGAVILFHDMYPTTRDALPAIIEGLRGLGYRFETIEDYSATRFGRPSYEVVPGPKLYDPCTNEQERGCLYVGSERAPVCGRFWNAYMVADGGATLGAPLSSPAFSSSVNALTQTFERGSIELHPDSDASCEIIVETTQASGAAP